MKNKFIIFLFGILLFGLISSNALAEQQGIKVSPAVVNITLNKKDIEQDAWVGIKNNYSVKIDLTAELKGVDQEQGSLTPTKDLPNQLKNNLELNTNKFSLEPGKSINIRVRVKNTANLSPGGNYASLVIKQQSDKNNTIGLQPAVSVGIFIVKEEGATRQVELDLIKPNRFLWDMPGSVTLSFVNKGNVGATPRGHVSVVSGNKTNSFGIINQESLQIFPNNRITSVTDLSKKTFFSLPGKKTILVTYRYDTKEETTTVSKSFLYIPSWLFILLGLAIIGTFFVLKKIRKPISKKHNKKQSKSKKINIKDDSETTIFKFK